MRLYQVFQIFRYTYIYSIPYKSSNRFGKTRLAITVLIILSYTIGIVVWMQIGQDIEDLLAYIIICNYSQFFVTTSILAYVEQRLFNYHNLLKLIAKIDQWNSKFHSNFRTQIKLYRCKIQINILLLFSLVSLLSFAYQDIIFFVSVGFEDLSQGLNVIVCVGTYYLCTLWNFCGMVFVSGTMIILQKQASKLIEMVPTIQSYKIFTVMQYEWYETCKNFNEIFSWFLFSITLVMLANTVASSLMLIYHTGDFNMETFAWSSLIFLTLYLVVLQSVVKIRVQVSCIHYFEANSE